MNEKGFTGWDVLILLTTVALLMGLVILANAPRARDRAPRIQCISNLKQVALAFRMWANEHEDQYPMAVPLAKGGAGEPSLEGSPIPAFVTISNEMVFAKILYCPLDKERSRTNIFEGLKARNVSYLIGIDACATNPAAILTADRNIVPTDADEPQGLLSIPRWQAVEWSPKLHNQQGNIALADGSASQATQNGLQRALSGTGFQTNRFAVP